MGRRTSIPAAVALIGRGGSARADTARAGGRGSADVKNAPPPLGWLSWNSFMSSINAQVIEENAQAMVTSGLLVTTRSRSPEAGRPTWPPW